MKNEVEISELPTSEKPNKRRALERKRLERMRGQGMYEKKPSLIQSSEELYKALHEVEDAKRRRIRKAQDYAFQVRAGEIKPIDAFLGGAKNDDKTPG
jgi:hypothetical protein